MMETHRKVATGISYFGNRNPRHFVEDLEEILEHHCTFIVHTFSENDREFYKETMQELVELSKGAGLEVYLDPWGVGKVFGGEAYSSFALKNRDACQVLSNGELAPAACMNHPKFREFIRQWIDDAVEIGADVLFWDEPHFYIDWQNKDKLLFWSCWCSYCKERYRKLFEENLPPSLSEEIALLREESIVDFLTEVCDYAKSKGVKNAVCLLPYKTGQMGLRNWSRVAAIASVDLIGTDPYWSFPKQVNLEEFVGTWSREVNRLAKRYGKEGQIWIQNFRIPEGAEEEVRRAIEVAYAAGIRNFAAWSFYGTGYMSYIRCGNPQKVWDTLGESYAKLHSGSLS